MLRLDLAAGGGAVSVSGGNLTLVVIVAVIALLALAVAGWLVRDVLAASQGTEKMQEIAHAVQEGAAAYLRRQFRTLGVFVVIIFFVLLLLPAELGLAVIEGLADDVEIAHTDAGLSIRMSWPSSAAAS